MPVLRRADALAAIVDTRRTVAISGTHGKTTTSTMTTLILRAAGWHPSFLIGGEPNEVGSNAAYDEGEWLVVEADESDGTFIEIAPEAVILTNVEARPPRPLRRHGRPRGGLRPLPARPPPGPGWPAPTTPARPAWRPR